MNEKMWEKWGFLLQVTPKVYPLYPKWGNQWVSDG